MRDGETQYAGKSVVRNTTSERREKLLTAARKLFFKNGYGGTTMLQIANRAGYSKRTVYLDFKNKDELFMLIAIEGMELLLPKLNKIPGAELPIEEAINRYLEAAIQFVQENDKYFPIFKDVTADIVSNSPNYIKKRVAEIEYACLIGPVTAAEKAIKDGLVININPMEAAGILVGTVIGIIMLSMGGSQNTYSKKHLESLIGKAAQIFWRGVKK